MAPGCHSRDMIGLSHALARSERMVGRRIAGEYILVPLVGRGADVEAIYNLNGMGALIWERLNGRTSGEDIVRSIVEQFDVDWDAASRDYVEFVEKLVSVNAVSVKAAESD